MTIPFSIIHMSTLITRTRTPVYSDSSPAVERPCFGCGRFCLRKDPMVKSLGAIMAGREIIMTLSYD